MICEDLSFDCTQCMGMETNNGHKDTYAGNNGFKIAQLEIGYFKEEISDHIDVNTWMNSVDLKYLLHSLKKKYGNLILEL